MANTLPVLTIAELHPLLPELALAASAFALLLFDTKHRVIGFRELFGCTLKGASVYPREVVKIALEHTAAAVILVHYDPSEDPEPSQANRMLSITLKNALNLIGTPLLDHVVVGYRGYVSLAERGYL